MKAKKSDKRVEVKISPSTPVVDDLDYKRKIEAVLFSAGRKVELEFLTSVIGANDKNLVKKALFELKEEYDLKNSSLMIIDDGNMWKISVREKYLPIVRKIVADTELSKTVMETLAVIAWKSPVLQSELIKIRTNKAYDHIEELLETGFVTKEKKGRSFILKVTTKFYDYFDVEGKEDIREVFSKIKEKPIQKKVDEFEKSGQKKLGSLEIVKTSPDNSKTIRQAEDDMDKRKVGRFEVYDEENEELKDNSLSQGPSSIDVQKTIFSAAKEDANKRKLEEETLKIKTKKIVEELLKDDKKEKK